MNKQHNKRSPPQWFIDALAATGESRRITVAGASIHFLRWGDKNKPGLALLPGGGGHAHWYSHVAPLLAEQFNVVSLDLSGMGDSDRRATYSHETIVKEVLAVCEDAGMMQTNVPPILVGHSMGGQFVVRVAIAHAKRLLGIIAVDALRQVMLEKDPAVVTFRDKGRLGRSSNRVYPDRATAISRFRLSPTPEQEIVTDYVLAHIGEHSVHQVDDGWTWKYDPNVSSLAILGLEFKDQIADLDCKVAAVFGEKSHIVDEHSISRMDEATRGMVPSFIIPGTSHYPMIDDPLKFVAAIRAISCQWVADYRRTVA